MSEPFNPFSNMQIQEVHLERLRLVAQRRLSKYECAQSIKVEVWPEAISESLVAMLEMHVVGKQRVRIEKVRWPRDWWQHFKDRWFPKWALKRWPVQCTEREFNIGFTVCCPHLPSEGRDRGEHLTFIMAMHDQLSAYPPWMERKP